MDIDVNRLLEALINGIFGGGLALAIFNWLRVRKAKKAGVSAVEQVAHVQTTPRDKISDPLTVYLRQELRRAHEKHKKDANRIDRLEAHIWLGKPPPPP
jgi:hypothetical protein